MTIGGRIRQLRETLGLSQTALADAVGSTKQNIYKYETGIITNIPSDKIEQIAAALNTTPSYLMGWEAPAEQVPSGFLPMPDMVQVPLIGQIACGTPITAEENVEGMVSIPAGWRATFTLICKGDSMEPRIHDGDLVAIRKQDSVEQGQIAAVRIDGEATLKHVYVYPTYIELRPQNPAYESIIKIGDEMNDVLIEGLAVGLCRGLE